MSPVYECPRPQKPCIYLKIAGVVVLSAFATLYPFRRRTTEAVQRQDERLKQLETMQGELRSNTVAVARMAEAVDRLTKRMDRID